MSLWGMILNVLIGLCITENPERKEEAEEKEDLSFISYGSD